MATYKRRRVDIYIEDGSALDKRLQAYAELRGISYSKAVTEAVDLGVYHHMMANLEIQERVFQKD